MAAAWTSTTKDELIISGFTSAWSAPGWVTIAGASDRQSSARIGVRALESGLVECGLLRAAEPGRSLHAVPCWPHPGRGFWRHG